MPILRRRYFDNVSKRRGLLSLPRCGWRKKDLKIGCGARGVSLLDLSKIHLASAERDREIKASAHEKGGVALQYLRRKTAFFCVNLFRKSRLFFAAETFA
jgi:hypothetical protein